MHNSNVNPSELKCSQTWKPPLCHHARMSGLFFTKKVPEQQIHPFCLFVFFKNIPSLTRAQARLRKLVCMCGLEPQIPTSHPDISGLVKVLNILSVYY